MNTLTVNQNAIIESILKEFETSNNTAKTPSDFPFFDELITQSEIDLKEIAELDKRFEIGKQFITNQIYADFKIIEPFIKKSNLACSLVVEGNYKVIKIGTGFYANGNVKDSFGLHYEAEYGYKEFKSGKSCIEYIGYMVHVGWQGARKPDLNSAINSLEFKDKFVAIFNTVNK